MLSALTACWSQGGTGLSPRDGGPSLASFVDASTPRPLPPSDAGGVAGGYDAGLAREQDAGVPPVEPDAGVPPTPPTDAGRPIDPVDDAGSNPPVTSPDAGSPPSGGGTFACGDIAGCASHCNNVAACRMQCRSYGTPTEQARYDALYLCITIHGCNDVTCSLAFCSNEVTACRASGKSCSAVLQCADTCTDDTCEQACIATGTVYARQLIDMIIACGQTHNCSDAACLLASCRPQVDACLAI